MSDFAGVSGEHVLGAGEARVSADERERGFFAGIALVIAATVVAGFGTWALRGKVMFPAPPLVHLHAVIYMSWVAIFVAQTTLIRQGSARAHRRLGWIAVLVAAMMCVLGPLTAIEAVATHRVPPFFPNNIFLAMNFLNIACFAPLFMAAIILRRSTGWHRRLMLGAMLAVIGPGVARITVSLGLGHWAGLAGMAIVLIYAAAGMLCDLRLRRRIHPAYYVTALAVLVEGIGPGPLGMTQVFIDMAKALAAAA
jgi:hypothetical protein